LNGRTFEERNSIERRGDIAFKNGEGLFEQELKDVNGVELTFSSPFFEGLPILTPISPVFTSAF
jgi:hypothetical protein